MNIIVNSSNVQDTDMETLFADEPVHFTEQTELSALLEELGIYKSRSQARQAGRTGPIPQGWTDEFKASKKHRLWIWNPSE